MILCVCVWCAYVFYVPDNKILFIICVIKAQLCVIMTLEVTPICAATFLHDLSLICRAIHNSRTRARN